MTDPTILEGTNPPLKLAFDFNRICDIEEELGISGFDMSQAVLRNFRTLRSIVRIGLAEHNAVEDDKAAGRIIAVVGLEPVAKAVSKALSDGVKAAGGASA
nr:hypothetical protein [Sphingomonas sp. Y57]